MSRPRQVLAMGGGGFLMEPDNPLLDRHLLGLSRKERPRTCFLGTATGDSEWGRDRFRAAMSKLPCEPMELSLFQPPRDLRGTLLAQDVVYVGGGNTRNLLVLWREWGLDHLLREAYEAGTVVGGVSAGALCWFEAGLSDSVVPGELHPLRGLGWLQGSFSPHDDGEPERRAIHAACVEDGRLPSGWGVEDGVALHYVDGTLRDVVSSRRGGHAWRVRLSSGRAVREPVEARCLGEPSPG